jgi:hypothetical protein
MLLETPFSSVDIVTTLRVGRLRIQGSIPDRSKMFFYSPQGPDRVHPVYYAMGTGGFLSQSKAARA